MLDPIIRAALRYRVLVVMLALAAMGYGTFLATQMPIDVLPDLDRPRVALMTECPGLASEEVEALVTTPIESAMLGSNGVTMVRSQSVAGLSIVFVEFDWAIELRTARQTVQERLATVMGSLPPGIEVHMTPPGSVLGQILQVGIVSTTGATNPMELGTIAMWDVRPRLLRIPGVAEVFVAGGDRKQYQVLLNPDAMREFNVSVKHVEEALRASNLNATGGLDIRGDAERPIRILARLGPDPKKVIADLNRIPVRTTPQRVILLEGVGRVVEGPAVKRGDASVNGVPGIVLTVMKQPHADTRAVTDAVFAAIRDLEPSLPKDLSVNYELFRMKNFIDRGISNIGEALILGAGLVLVVLTLFLMNVRTTFISLTAIPISLAITVIVFRAIGKVTGVELSINVMTLGGIAVAMGELVDDAIVDVENIFRRLRENASSAMAQSPLRVVYEASREVRGAIVFGTFVVILVFLPLFALDGIEGRLFAPLGLAYIVSIFASLVVSLTVTPVLSSYLLANSRAIHRTGDGPLLGLLKTLAKPLVRFSMKRAGTLLLLTWLAAGAAVWLASRLGADFLPPFDEGSVQLNVSIPVGSSLEASNSTAAIVDRKLGSLRKTEANPTGLILNFSRKTGRAERDEHTEPVNRSEYILSVNPDSGLSREEILKRLLTDLRETLPGVDFEAEQPIVDMISHSISGVAAQIAIKIYGEDIEQLRRAAEQVKNAIASTPGLVPPVVEAQEMTDEVHVRLRPADLAFHGLTREDVAGTVQTALQGQVVSQVVDGPRRFDLLVKLDDPYRTDLSRLGQLRIDQPDGKSAVMLGEVATISDGSGPNTVNRENARRRIVIRCNARSRDLASLVGELRERVETQVKPILPKGYYIEFSGQFESQQRATRLIVVLALISVVGMFAVLMVLFPSPRIVFQILNALPTAFIGGVLALAITGQTLTVASLVGFISLGGIAVRNGILLVSHYVYLLKVENEEFSQEMIVRGSMERLAPVLMTALTAGIALVPLVLGGHQPGREILYPVATVILGGLITATFCEFLIHPGLFWRFSGRDAEKLAKTRRHDW